MRAKFFSVLFAVVTVSILLVSCQKEIDGSGSTGGGLPPAIQKPKLGTRWEYVYFSYYTNGGLRESKFITYKAASEETLGGETWLRIIDESTLATVYYLKVKADGLYQYANNASNRFLKDPAVLNDTYASYNAGAAEDFTVKGIKNSIITGISSNTEVNYYEGVKNALVIDKIWYNDKIWIAQHSLYVKTALGPYYRYSNMILQKITY